MEDEKNIAKALRNAVNKIKDLSAEIKKYEGRISELNTEKERLYNENEQFRHSAYTLDNLKAEIEKLRNDNEKLNKYIESARIIEANYSTVDLERLGLEHALEKTPEYIKKLGDQCASLESTVKGKDAELKELKFGYLKLEEKVKEGEDKISKIKSEYEIILSKYNVLKEKSDDELVKILPDKLDNTIMEGELTYCKKDNKKLKYAAAVLGFLTLSSGTYALINRLHQKNNVEQKKVEEIVDLKKEPYYFEIKEFEKLKSIVKGGNKMVYLDKCINGFKNVNILDADSESKNIFRDGYINTARTIVRGNLDKAIEDLNALESYIANTLKEEAEKNNPRTRDDILKEIEIIKKQQPKTDKGSIELNRLRAELKEFDKKK